MQRITKIAMAASLLLVTACTTASLEELRRTTPSGDPFHAALSQEYLAFAESEATQYDWGSSKHFADKGLAAAYGRDVAPEDPAEWGIEEQYMSALLGARDQLLSVMTPDTVNAQPATAARAMFFYDCWVEQQEEAWQVDDITSCREGFYRAVRTLAGAPEPEPEPEDLTPLIFSSSYILFFNFDEYVLTPEAEGILDTVADDLKTSGEEVYEVILNGHADRSGNVEYNLRLSQKRAEAAKAGLITRGIPEDYIRYYAFGETDNRIPTPDAKTERANRRVEIFFNQ